MLGLLHQVVGILQEFGDDGLDVLADVAGLCESGAVADGKGHIQTPRQRLGQQGLTCGEGWKLHVTPEGSHCNPTARFKVMGQCYSGVLS